MFDGIFINKLLISLAVSQDSANIDFNIAASVAQNASPNILSELVFDPIRTTNLQVGAGYLWLVGSGTAIGITGQYSDSFSVSGSAKDYDFQSDNRTDPFSISKSSLDDSQIRNMAIETFSKKRWFDTPGHYLTGGIGFEKNIYHLHITDGTQLLPDPGKIPNLNSSYDPEFKNTYIFISTEHQLFNGFLSFRAQRNWSHLDASADWNLRQEFAHPKSFIHDGDGKGYTFTLRYTYPLFEKIDLYSQISTRKIEIDDGFDQVFFADGDSIVTKLNEVNEESNSILIGTKFIF